MRFKSSLKVIAVAVVSLSFVDGATPPSVETPIDPGNFKASQAGVKSVPGADGLVASGSKGVENSVHYIEGYADRNSYAPGDTISFFVSTTSPTYTIQIVRVEYPWWVDEPVVAEETGLTGEFHEIPAENGWLGANWPASFNMIVGDAWETGNYRARFVTEDNNVKYFPFFVRPTVPGSSSRIVYIANFNNANAYNPWGGKSFYHGTPAAVKISFLRPLSDHNGLGRITKLQRLHCHLEDMGIELEYLTEWDVQQNPCLLRNYDVVIIAGHHEYVTSRFYDAVQDHHDRGGHLAFFSADDIYWQVRYEDDGNTLVGYKTVALEDDPLNGIVDCFVSWKWHKNPLNRPAEELKGIRRAVGFKHFLTEPYLVQMASHWIFEGTGLQNGDEFGGSMATGEQDFLKPASPDVDVLLYAYRDQINPDNPPPKGMEGTEVCAVYYADTSEYGFPNGNGGMVFAAGTIAGWIFGMNQEPGSELVRFVTSTILQRMLDNPPPPPGGDCLIPKWCPFILVPGDLPTIQAAIDSAYEFDEIVVAPGTYNETIDFHGKLITLRSSGGAEITIIDGNGLNDSVVTCSSGEGPDTVLDGFTLTGGLAAWGGGMYVDSNSSPTVVNCLFNGNIANKNGGGMYIGSGSPTLSSSFFCDNIPNHMFGPYNDGGDNEFCPMCDGDVNGNGAVGVADLLELLATWGQCPDEPDSCFADIDGNGYVGTSDLLTLFENWGPCE